MPADWPKRNKLPPDFANREHDSQTVRDALLEIDVLMAERNILKHQHAATQEHIREQRRRIDAQLDRLSAQARAGVPCSLEEIDTLRDQLDQLCVVYDDNLGDYARQDARIAQEIDRLEARVAAWRNSLN